MAPVHVSTSRTLQSPACKSLPKRCCSPSDGVHGDGPGVDKLRVKENPSLGTVQPGSLDLIQAAVGPEDGSAQVVHGQPLGADEPCRTDGHGQRFGDMWLLALSQGPDPKPRDGEAQSRTGPAL